MSVSSGPNESPWSGGPAGDLLSQASAVLLREARRLPSTSSMPADVAGRVCPVTGAAMPLPNTNKGHLGQQAHELVAGLLAAFGQAPGNVGDAGGSLPLVGHKTGMAGRACPVTKASVLPGGFDLDQLRKQAHAFIETLLITFNDATGEKGLPTEDKVPLLQCEAPVQAGSEARAILTVGNEEATPSDVSLYCTNFVADTGHEIPSLRVSVSPRRATIPANGEATFQIRLSVSQQAPSGIYSGLVQAMGSKYVKAVLSVEVL
jgi:hypothetical protein